MPPYVIALILIIAFAAAVASGRATHKTPYGIGDITLREEDLYKHACDLSFSQLSKKGPARSTWPLPRLNAAYSYIKTVYRWFSAETSGTTPIIQSAEWLLDNFYIIEEQVDSIRRELPKKHHVRLPALRFGKFAGYARIQALAEDLVSHTNSKIDEGVIIKFTQECQNANPLTIRELWAFSPMIRAAIVGRLSLACGELALSYKMRKKALDAAELFAKSEKENDQKAYSKLLSIIDLYSRSQIPFSHSFMEFLSYRLRRGSRNAGRVLEYMEESLARQGSSTEKMTRAEHNFQALNRVTIENCISSLKTVSSLDWMEAFVKLSLTETFLMADPSKIYPDMDIISKELYRETIEDLAKKIKVSEIHIAKAALDLSISVEGDSSSAQVSVRNHIGYYLVSDGRAELEKRLHFKPDVIEAAAKLIKRRSFPIYIISILLPAALVASFFSLAAVNSKNYSSGIRSAILYTLTFLVFLLAFTEITSALINNIISILLKPKIIPRMDFKDGIPDSSPLMIVVPALLSDPEKAENLALSLEIHYLATHSDNVYFTLLGDYKDNDQETAPGDSEITENALNVIKELNTRYADKINTQSSLPRFYYMHRRRQYSEGEGRYMGYERKRGALIAFNQALLGRDDGSWEILSSPLAELPCVKYVLTLDADTRLPHEAAAKLTGSAEHPLNAPHLNENGRIVSAGYGIFQPRIAVDLTSASSSAFAALYGGDFGIDPYSTAVSDIYQDLFGEGIFNGKGLYRLELFDELLTETIPEGRILSHDLLEGSFLRAGLVTDVNLVDSTPSKYSSYAMRQHRWYRGDWQLLPYIFPHIKLKNGKKIRNPISPLSKWKIIDNFRRSLTSLSLLLLIIMGFTIFGGSNLAWLALILLCMSFAAFSCFIEGIITGNLMRRLRFKLPAVFGLRSSISKLLLQLSLLPHQSIIALSAISTTIWRLTIVKRRLLQWITASDAEKAGKNSLQAYYMLTLGSLPIILIFLALSIIYKPSGILTAAPLSVLWLLSPYAAWKVSIPQLQEPSLLPEADNNYLRKIAQDIWNYFSNYTNGDNHFLPPDNYQEDPYKGVAPRTSPTNIGLGMLSTLCARDMCFINTAELSDRISDTLDTIERMDKWNGHLFNWYDTRTLRILRPKYVSAVDSGNFICYLLVVIQGLKEYKNKCEEEDSELRNNLDNLIKRIDALISPCSFKHFWDKNRNMMSIGYNADNNKLDTSYYDLLASEARQVVFLAVANNDIPLKAWSRMGRTLARLGRRKGLASWSGTMFEYLMPNIIIKNYKYSLLDEACYFALFSQRKYAMKLGIPWGISESGFSLLDVNLNYQYKAFGIPWLGLKRGLADDAVVSPYATFLSFPLLPEKAVMNLKCLESLGLRGIYGFYEAVDYTPGRTNDSARGAIVKSYMAHHLGMSMASIANQLGGMKLQKRFHSIPIIHASEILLQERSPRDVFFTREGHEKPAQLKDTSKKAFDAVRKLGIPNKSQPAVHLLSNGNYNVMITSKGTGYSRVGNIAVNRWRSDKTDDRYGVFIFIRDMSSSKVWPFGYSDRICQNSKQGYTSYDGLTETRPDRYNVKFSPAQAVFMRRDGETETITEITVSPTEDTEFRKVSITNTGSITRLYEITACFEPVITYPEADIDHPAFTNLFVKTSYLPSCNGLIASRRPRSIHETPHHLSFSVSVEGRQAGDVQHETDRLLFIGRNRDIFCPISMEVGRPLTGATGSVLDPVMCLRIMLEVNPGETAKLSYAIAYDINYDKLITKCTRYVSPQVSGDAFLMAAARSMAEMRFLGLTEQEFLLYTEMASFVIFNSAALKNGAANTLSNTNGKGALWAHGISGDLPIICLFIEKLEETDLLDDLLKAHEFWSLQGLKTDLVIFDMEHGGYVRPLHATMLDIITTAQSREKLDRPGGIFLLDANQVSENERIIISMAACISLKGRDGSLSSRLKTSAQKFSTTQWMPRLIKNKSNASVNEYAEYVNAVGHLQCFNGIGGFDENTGVYVIRLVPGVTTPMPWVNIISRPEFGFMVTESHLGCTWYRNSRENRITPWSNDPVSDIPGEAVYIRDDNTGQITGATPLPVKDNKEWEVRHGFGYTTWRSGINGIIHDLTAFTDWDLPVKTIILTLDNTTPSPRNITVSYFVKPVLGPSNRGPARQTVSGRVHINKDEMSGKPNFIHLNNPWNTYFSDKIVFLGCSEKSASYTCNQDEYLGNRSMQSPAALERQSLSGSSVVNSDPCAAAMATVSIDANGSRTIVFLLGVADNKNAAENIIENICTGETARFSFNRAASEWQNILGSMRFETPDRSLNCIMNGWLRYQTLSCRMWGRTAFYQSGGATGFRDQLQDCLSFASTHPELCKDQILLHASRQFEEGDVMHWWHDSPFKSGNPSGTRTRYSDDLLWLPLATFSYISITGDNEILRCTVPFVTSRPLTVEEDERYEEVNISENTASLYEHCLRAINYSLGKGFGAHGLPLMGSGDWNDGMNRVGANGRGESVWLGWFLYYVLSGFIPLCNIMGDNDNAEKFVEYMQPLKASLNDAAWDGNWYRRAWFDDGSVLGSVINSECRIDSISQSWSVISGAGEPKKCVEAMKSLETQLVDNESGLIKLLTPAFCNSTPDPGYISSYLPGVRENGGQYTHAAAWAIIAFAKLSEGDKAMSLFSMVNPVNHSRTPMECARYKGEPYVCAADVYSEHPHSGRAGWTWYTGSSAWLYRAASEHLLGIVKKDNMMYVDPCIPHFWKGFRAWYTINGTTWEIEVSNPDNVSSGVRTIILNGNVIKNEGETSGMSFPLVNDRPKQSVRVIMGQGSANVTTVE